MFFAGVGADGGCGCLVRPCVVVCADVWVCVLVCCVCDFDGLLGVFGCLACCASTCVSSTFVCSNVTCGQSFVVFKRRCFSSMCGSNRQCFHIAHMCFNLGTIVFQMRYVLCCFRRASDGISRGQLLSKV